MKHVLAITMAALLATASSWAQAVSTAQINGVVQDSSGLAVPGAEVKATQTATGLVRTATSGADGSYLLTNLPVGPYQLEVSKEGFSKYVQSGIVLQVGSNPTVEIFMKVGSVSEQVTVEANAALVETRSTGVGNVIENQRVVEMPLNGRQATQLIFLSGLATPGGGANLNTIRNYPTVNISVAGGQGNGITYLLDGGTHNDSFNNLNLPLPFPDALQEFRVETSALPAQYGHHSAAAINGVTKSGANEMHGDLFEFLRNGNMNARNFFAASRDTLKRNQFGGTIGGALVRDKLFYFGGYQATLERSDPPTTIAFVPTAATLTGDFTALASPSCNGGRQITLAASQGFIGNRIAPTLLSAPAVKLASFLPVSADPCGRAQYSLKNNSNDQMYVSKVDYQLSSTHSIFGRFLSAVRDQTSSYDGTNILTVSNAASIYRVYSFVFGDTYLIGPGTVSSFRATFNRTKTEKDSDKSVSFADLGVKMISGVPNFSRVTVSNNGFAYAGASATPSVFNTTNFQFTEDVSLIRGSHQIGIGANYIHPMLNQRSGLNAGGGFTFNGQVTGLSMADYMIGNASAFSQGTFSTGYNRQHYVGLYAQDVWKATSRLTVSAGIRWEPYLPTYSKYGWFSHFDQSLFNQNVHSNVFVNAPAGLIFNGDPQYQSGNYAHNSRMAQVAPRIGIVWDPKGDGRMTVRAAYGLFRDRPHLFYSVGYANDPPIGNLIALNNVKFSDPWSAYPGGNPFPLLLSKNIPFQTAGSYVNNPVDAKPTYLNQWNLSIQRQLGQSWLVSGTYLGNNTIHLWTGNQANPGVFLGLGACTINGVSYPVCSTTANVNQRRQLALQNGDQGKYYGSVSMMDDGGTGSYHGLLLSVQRRVTRGINMQANYTWSHCISDVANSELGVAGPLYMVPGNRRVDRSNCATSDRRHVVNISGVAQAPKFNNKALQMIAGDWQLSPIVSARSAAFFTVTTGIDNALTGQGNRPNLLSSDPYAPNQSVDRWLAIGAFGAPTPGTYGNLGASNLKGPGSLSVDLAISRTFPIREKQTLQLRGEAFNIINRLNANTPVATTNSGTFGIIQTGGDPRILQVALKYMF